MNQCSGALCLQTEEVTFYIISVIIGRLGVYEFINLCLDYYCDPVSLINFTRGINPIRVIHQNSADSGLITIKSRMA